MNNRLTQAQITLDFNIVVRDIFEASFYQLRVHKPHPQPFLSFFFLKTLFVAFYFSLLFSYTVGTQSKMLIVSTTYNECMD